MLSRSEEKLIRNLQRRRVRESEGLFLAEGVRVVEELLAAGIVLRLVLLSPSLEDTERGAALARRLESEPATRSVDAATLGALADTRTTQGVLAVAEVPSDGLGDVEPRGAAVALVLDGVQDPGNLGTLTRAAAAFGCELVACLPGTVDPWNPKAVRASAGTVFRLPVLRTDPEALAEWLDRHGFRLVGAEAEGEPVGDVTASQRIALAVGNEGAGLSPAVRERCHQLVSVPMRGGTESLNVAVAGGILLYELTRERE